MPPNVQLGPLVSVVIPVWNYASFLPTAIDSVIAQTYRRRHCLIVDDGSTDSTPDVARTMVARDRRISYLLLDRRGIAAARNSGLRGIDGERPVPFAGRELRLNALLPVAISPDAPFSFWRRGSGVDHGRNS